MYMEFLALKHIGFYELRTHCILCFAFSPVHAGLVSPYRMHYLPRWITTGLPYARVVELVSPRDGPVSFFHLDIWQI